MDAPVITALALTNLHESPFNHRRRFNDKTIAELAQDIYEVGLQQPLLVRRLTLSVDGVIAFNKAHPDRAGEHDGQYEIVFGARRFRACKVAELATVPCMVRELTDGESRRLQISENLQREDVHPIEEAEGFFALLGDKEQPITVDELCAQVAKSRSHVYGRLKLLQAVPQVRDACLAGDIDSQVALLIARLRVPKLQEKALAAIKGEYYDLGDGGKKSFRNIQGLLKDNFTLGLKEAIFDTQDALLVEEAGACGDCPKLLANAPEYADLLDIKEGHNYGYHRPASPQTCTDPDCFDAKKKQHLKNRATELEQAGKTVIAGAKARAAVDQYGNVKGSYIALKDVKAELKVAGNAKKEKAALKDIPVVTIQDPRTGKTHEAVALADAQAAGIKTEPAPKSGGSSRTNSDYAAQQKKRDAEAARQAKFNQELLSRVRATVATQPRSAFDLRLMAISALQSLASYEYDEEREALCKLWGLDPEALSDDEEIAHALDQVGGENIPLLLLDCAFIRDISIATYDGEEPSSLLAAAQQYGVDVEALRAELDAAPAEAEEEAEA